MFPYEDKGEFFDPDTDPDEGYTDVPGLVATLTKVPDRMHGTEMGEGMVMEYKVFPDQNGQLPEDSESGPWDGDDEDDEMDDFQESLF